MTTPDSADPGPEPARLPPEPTIRVARRPEPRPVRQGEGAADSSSTPEAPPADEPTVGLGGRVPIARQRTLRFGRPTPVKVTVSARPRPKRRHRMWPWIAAVVLALLVLGVILLVMLLRGATIDGGTDLVGWGRTSAPASTATVFTPAFAEPLSHAA